MVKKKSSKPSRKNKKLCTFCKGKHDISKCVKKERYEYLKNNPDLSSLMEYIYEKLYKFVYSKETDLKKRLVKSRNFLHIKKIAEKIIDFGINRPHDYIDFCNKKFGKKHFYQWSNVETNYKKFINEFYMTWPKEKIDESYIKLKILKKIFKKEKEFKNKIYHEVVKGTIHPVACLMLVKNMDEFTDEYIDWSKWKIYLLLDNKKTKIK